MPKLNNYIEHIYCEDCGCKVYSRFQDYKKCLTCLKKVMDKIESRCKTGCKIIFKTKFDRITIFLLHLHQIHVFIGFCLNSS